MPILRLVISVLQFPHVLIYLVLSIRLLILSTVETKNSGRLPDRARLTWLHRLTAGFGLFFRPMVIYGLHFGINRQDKNTNYKSNFAIVFRVNDFDGLSQNGKSSRYQTDTKLQTMTRVAWRHLKIPKVIRFLYGANKFLVTWSINA